VGKKAPENQWGGLTLEWVASTPPTEHNFETDPVCEHGPYDFDRVVPPHWDPKDYPLPPQAQAGGRPAIAHSPEKP
jgi:cytochrome c oxidase subunit 1